MLIYLWITQAKKTQFKYFEQIKLGMSSYKQNYWWEGFWKFQERLICEYYTSQFAEMWKFKGVFL